MKGTISRIIGLLLFIMVLPVCAYAQNVSVRGTVTDNSGEPLIGVNVLQVGTTNGIITDVNGNYTLSVPSNATLSFSFVGYTTQNVQVNGRNLINVVMSEDSELLEEVVVVGYGTAKKSDISGSVASVDRDQMMKKAPQNVAQGLRGAAPGVIVQASDGAPEGNTTVRIRGIATINGTAEPLYVVDGVQVGTNANFLNPSDIESIEVLKDASATAIYGARGANGVVMITTKHGSKGATHLSFTADFGIQTLASKLNTGNADQFAQRIRIARENDGALIQMPIWQSKYDGQRRTIDWQDELTRASLKQQYNLSVSGGTDKTQSLFSVGYLNNDGIIYNTNYKRLSARANVKTKVLDFIEVGGDLNFVHTENHGSNIGTGNNGNMSSLRDMAFLTPTMDYVDENGNYIQPNLVNPDGTYGVFWQTTGDSEIPRGQDNVYAAQMEANGKTKTNRIFASGYIDIKLLKGLNVKSVASYNFYANDYNDFTYIKHRYNNGKEVPIANYKALNTYTLNPTQSNELAIETYMTYNYQNDIHNLTLMAGNSVSNTFGSWTRVSAEGFPSETIRNIALTTDVTTKTAGGADNLQTRYISYFGRAMYSLMDRYIATATIRRDGSSNFGSGNRWGTFPSAALAWRVSEEPFMKDVKNISNLKLRLGWGRTGNAGNATDLSVPQFGVDRVGYYFLSQGSAASAYSTANGMAALNVIDPNLKWETNEQTNVGIDLGLFNNSLNITVDYFVRTAKDLLIYKSIRPSTGFTQVYTNFGKIRNKGFEFSVNYNKQVGDWTYGATLTGSTLKNEVVECGNDIFSMQDRVGAGMHWDTHSIVREGYEVGSFYGYQVEGIFKSQEEVDKYNAIARSQKPDPFDYYIEQNTKVGDFRYKDINHDGHIDTKDQTVIGHGFPKLNFGLTLNAGYKNWDLSVYSYGVLGQDILSYSAMKMSLLDPGDDGVTNILNSAADEAWHPTSNPNGTLPILSIRDAAYNSRCSDAWIKNGDYLKINNIQIGYTFSKDLLKPLRIESARIYAAVNNLCTISGYNKYGDPELGQDRVIFQGLDVGTYPSPRVYSLGLNVQF